MGGDGLSGVFISYRRQDSGGWAQNINDRLERRFGPSRVFMDVEDVPGAVDFEDFIAQRLRGADALLAVIGPGWLTAADEDGRPRLQASNDLLRREIAIALMIGVKVVPVLVDNASMPRASDLPDDLKRLAGINALQLRPTSFAADAEELVNQLEEIVTVPPLPWWRRVNQGLRQRRVLVSGAIGVGLAGMIFAAIAQSLDDESGPAAPLPEVTATSQAAPTSQTLPATREAQATTTEPSAPRIEITTPQDEEIGGRDFVQIAGSIDPPDAKVWISVTGSATTETFIVAGPIEPRPEGGWSAEAEAIGGPDDAGFPFLITAYAMDDEASAALQALVVDANTLLPTDQIPEPLAVDEIRYIRGAD